MKLKQYDIATCRTYMNSDTDTFLPGDAVRDFSYATDAHGIIISNDKNKITVLFANLKESFVRNINLRAYENNVAYTYTPLRIINAFDKK